MSGVTHDVYLKMLEMYRLNIARDTPLVEEMVEMERIEAPMLTRLVEVVDDVEQAEPPGESVPAAASEEAPGEVAAPAAQAPAEPAKQAPLEPGIRVRAPTAMCIIEARARRDFGRMTSLVWQRWEAEGPVDLRPRVITLGLDYAACTKAIAKDEIFAVFGGVPVNMADACSRWGCRPRALFTKVRGLFPWTDHQALHADTRKPFPPDCDHEPHTDGAFHAPAGQFFRRVPTRAHANCALVPRESVPPGAARLTNGILIRALVPIAIGDEVVLCIK